MALGSMNRTMNLPSLQRIAMEFERENDIMEQRQEMMDDVMDDAMDVGLEEEGDEVVEQVLEEIGVDLSQSVGVPPGSEALCIALLLTLSMFSSARPRRDCSQLLCQKPRLPKRLAVVVAEPTLATMISKHGLTACGVECGYSLRTTRYAVTTYLSYKCRVSGTSLGKRAPPRTNQTSNLKTLPRPTLGRGATSFRATRAFLPYRGNRSWPCLEEDRENVDWEFRRNGFVFYGGRSAGTRSALPGYQ